MRHLHRLAFHLHLLIVSYPVLTSWTIVPNSVMAALSMTITNNKDRSSSSFTTTTNSKKSNNHLLILGLGRVGREIAQQAAPYFETIVGTVRSNKSKSSVTAAAESETHLRCIPFALDSIRCELLQQRAKNMNISHVLITIPPPADKDEMAQLNAVYDMVETNLRTTAQSTETSRWVGVVSTTGVYGNHDGAWVTETSECKCSKTINDNNSRSSHNDSAYRFWKLEQDWQKRATRSGLRVRIFRCAGIYGPGRSALHTVYSRQGWNDTTNGTSASINIHKNNETMASITNRIHSHDLARAVVNSMLLLKIPNMHETECCCRVYNLADDLPANRDVVVQYAIRLFETAGIAKSTQTTMTTPSQREPKERSRRRESDQKRVSNQRMKQELLGNQSSLMFPTYKEGLPALFHSPDSPWRTTSVRTTPAKPDL